MINLETLQTYMILCSLLDRFKVTLHVNNLQKKRSKTKKKVFYYNF